jgi:choice-of-anchor B domain-containing protein
MGCWGHGARIHDAQCVNYHGPDPAYAGREICISGDEGAGLIIYDVTDKANVAIVSVTQYENVDYAHQCWFTEDHEHLLLGDEGVELSAGINTTLYAFDVRNLAAPINTGKWVSELASTDHNVFIRGNYAFLAGYSSGLRILDLTNIAQGQLTEVAYFDSFPAHNNPGYTAVWGVYPYFPSGVVALTGTSADALNLVVPDPMFMQ